MRRAILLALAGLAAIFWWRSPPKILTRLDSGSDNGAFAMGDENRRLFYVQKGFGHDVLNSVDLATGRTASRRLWGRRLKSFGPSDASSRVKIIVDNGVRAPKDTRYSLISLNGDDWTTRREETRPTADTADMLLFDTPYTSSTETPKTPGMSDDYGMSASISAAKLAPGLDVRLLVGDKLGPAKHYPTRGRPTAFVYTSSGTIVVAYESGVNAATLEEITPFAGTRARLLDLEGSVESMELAGDGLVALRAVRDGTRLSFVNLSRSKELLDLAWSKGGSTLLGADPLRKKLYFSMAVRGPDGWIQETGWAVPMDHASLREAGQFFSSMHEWPELRWKLIGHSVEILIVVFVLFAAWYFYGTMRDI